MKYQATLSIDLASARALKLTELVLQGHDWDSYGFRTDGFDAREPLGRLRCTMSPVRLEISAPEGAGELIIAGTVLGPGSRRVKPIVEAVATALEAALVNTAAAR
ncbi:hypothetical protein BH10ACT11_BH10ACT11_03590 [soil metagenome]